MTRIHLENVCKDYGQVRAVADLNMNIEPGEFISLLGPSGSGKTTTMRMIAGLEKPTSGRISIGGAVVSDDATFVPVHQRRLGMVFQSYAVWPHKTVLENVTFPLQMQGLSRSEQRKRALRTLERVGLSDHVGRYPAQLSGGQQQRVSLARALVGEPNVILFDEPLSNLDVQLRDSMRELVAELHAGSGTTSVYVTHDQAEAMALSDRIYLMSEGRLRQSGTPQDLYERPADRFVAEFIGMANTIPVRPADGGKTVHVGGSVLSVASISPGSQAPTLMIRPHHLRLTTETGAANVLSGTVRAVNYLGDRIRYSVLIDTGAAITVDGSTCGPRAHVGEIVRVHLPVEHCVVI